MSIFKNGEIEISYVNSKRGVNLNLKSNLKGEILDDNNKALSQEELELIMKEQQSKSKNIIK